jgi:metal-sulfur cluster biosynthetic enzyme
MTLTTPACPAADYLPEQAKNSVQIMYPEFEVILNLVREPTWTIAMIKDEDLKRMFE